MLRSALVSFWAAVPKVQARLKAAVADMRLQFAKRLYAGSSFGKRIYRQGTKGLAPLINEVQQLLS